MWALHRSINNKKVSLILTLSVTSNLMVNKNTVSQVAKLLIEPQFKISPLQFFCNVSLLSCSSYCWFIYLCICFHSVFGRFCFLFFISGGGGCFSPLFTFHILWNSALSFPPCDTLYGASETTVRFKSKMGGVGVILNYWTQAETWATVMAPDFPPLHFFLCLCQLRGFLSVVRTMRGWCRHSEGDVLYSDLVQMHPIMIMFCYLYVPPAPVPLLWKSERCKQLQRLLPFSQVFTTAALLSYHTDGGSSSSLLQHCTASRCVQGVDRTQELIHRWVTEKYTCTHITSLYFIHAYTSTRQQRWM